MTKKNIALLAGGNSGEAEISYKSASIIEKNIDDTLYNTYKISLFQKDWHYQDKEGNKHQIDKNDFSLTLNERLNVKELYSPFLENLGNPPPLKKFW